MKLRLVGFIILIGSSTVIPSDAIEGWNIWEDWLNRYTGVSTPAELEAAWTGQYRRWTNEGLLLLLRETSDERVDKEAIRRGELHTGLASLDSLLHRTGVLRIRGSRDGLYDLYFAKDANIDLLSVGFLYFQNEHVLIAEPNFLIPTAATPNDTLYSQQWAHGAMSSAGGILESCGRGRTMSVSFQ